MMPLDVVDPSSSAFKLIRAFVFLIPPSLFTRIGSYLQVQDCLPFSSKKKLVYMSRILFSSLFLFSSVKFHMQDILGKLFGLAFLCIFSFLIWTSDEEVMSFFLYCAPHIHACFFFPHIFLYFCLLLKNASNIIFIIIYCKVQSFDLLFIRNYLW